MRGLIVVLALSVVGVQVAHAEPAQATENKSGDGIEYSGQVPGQQGGSATSGQVIKGGTRPRVYSARELILSADAAGQPCVSTVRRTFATPEEAASFGSRQEAAWATIVGNYGLCPGVTLPQADPAILAEVFWGEVLLPKPAPKIEPGWAMTGRLAYLETQAPLTQTFTRDTPLGPLTITATGEFLVDWGDGTRTGPHQDAGAPWPDGRITHGYTRATTLDVVVTEQWRATWALAGRTGDLTALRTEGRIQDLPVREVQAVRNR
jgi:hypothetical protein